MAQANLWIGPVHMEGMEEFSAVRLECGGIVQLARFGSVEDGNALGSANPNHHDFGS